MSREVSKKAPAAPGTAGASAEAAPDGDRAVLGDTAPLRTREQLADAWWTGPMMGASAETLPRGHALIEPYIFDVRTKGSDRLTSLNYLLYGVTDRFSLGMITVAQYVVPRRGPASAPAVGDTTLIAQYRLTHYGERGWPVTIALVGEETLPSGRFDRLEDKRIARLGSGTRATTLAVYLQSYAWLANGRIVRFRLDSALRLPDRASPIGESVYGTPPGFRGSVNRGASTTIDGSMEYSLSRSWALAAEAAWQRSNSARVAGAVGSLNATDPYRARLPGSDAVYFVPAVEYSWTANLGVLLALRMSPKWHNSPASVTPVIAVNIVL